MQLGGRGSEKDNAKGHRMKNDHRHGFMIILLVAHSQNTASKRLETPFHKRIIFPISWKKRENSNHNNSNESTTMIMMRTNSDYESLQMCEVLRCCSYPRSSLASVTYHTRAIRCFPPP